MTLHQAYMTAMSALFVAVFAIILASLARHRRSLGAPAAKRFGGPTGRGQWLWALLPLLILAGVDFALLDSEPSATRQIPRHDERR